MGLEKVVRLFHLFVKTPFTLTSNILLLILKNIPSFFNLNRNISLAA